MITAQRPLMNSHGVDAGFISISVCVFSLPDETDITTTPRQGNARRHSRAEPAQTPAGIRHGTLRRRQPRPHDRHPCRTRSRHQRTAAMSREMRRAREGLTLIHLDGVDWQAFQRRFILITRYSLTSQAYGSYFAWRSAVWPKESVAPVKVPRAGCGGARRAARPRHHVTTSVLRLSWDGAVERGLPFSCGECGSAESEQPAAQRAPRRRVEAEILCIAGHRITVHWREKFAAHQRHIF